jgi:hypothetical protein
MDGLVVIYSYLLAILIVAYMLVQYLKGTWELLTVRNFAFLGFIVFQVTSVPPVIWMPQSDAYPISDPAGIAVQHLGWSTIFVVVALVVYEKGWFARPASKVITVSNVPPPDAALLPLALLCTVVAVALRFGVRVPLIGVLAGMTGIGLAAVSTGAVAWLWGRQLFNPVMAAIAIGVTGANALVAMIGEFGRRPLLAIAGALLWGVYFGGLRYKGPVRVLPIMGVFGFLGVFAVIVYSTTRDISAFKETLSLTPQQIAERLGEFTNGQDTGRRAMWIADRFNEDAFETNHLLTVKYFATFAIPRAIWADKPYPLSTYMADWSNREGVALGREGVTNPAGIIGNAAAEGGFYALIIYAIITGVFLRFFDEQLRQRPEQPMVILPLGCALGHVMGLARGESSTFAFNWIWTTLSCLIMMLLLLKIVRALAGQNAEGAFGEADADWDDYDADAYAAGAYETEHDDGRSGAGS